MVRVVWVDSCYVIVGSNRGLDILLFDVLRVLGPSADVWVLLFVVGVFAACVFAG